MRLRRAADRLRLVCEHLESALAAPDPLQVEADAWRATAVAGAAAGDVALARHFAGPASDPLMAWPVHCDVPEQVTAVRDALSVLRWNLDAEDTVPRPLVVSCLTTIADALDDIDAVLAGGPPS